MVTEPDDRWSYGVSAEPEAEDGWPPPPARVRRPADTIRLSTGRWTPASLGAPDPMAPAAADEIGIGLATNGDDGYRYELGYDADHGDSALRQDFDTDDGLGYDGYPVDDAVGHDDELDPDAEGVFHLELDEELDEEEESGGGKARRNAIEWAVVLVGAVLLALVLRAVLLQAFWIPSPSMESTLLVRDRVLVNKISYRLHDINRGDIVVFRRTDDEIARNPELPRDVIKRVIGLGGETIEIKDNVVMIDGQVLVEPYLDDGIVTSDFGPELVPEGHVFVMGDNRELSLDSRFETGAIAEDRVVGRAFFLFWPLDRLGSL